MKIPEILTQMMTQSKHAPARVIIILMALVFLACMGITGCSEATATATPTSIPTFAPIKELLQIEPDALPNAQLGVKYKTGILITQNVTPVGDIRIKQGALPAGLKLEFIEGENAAEISGIPDETGTFTITVFAWCKGTMVRGQTIEKEYEIVVEK